MTTRLGTVSESNQTATTVLTGRLDTGSLAGMEVIGVHFAGRQPGNVGTAFRGIFGSLQVNANGAFTYVLDNNDRDTDLLATGDTATERFVVTYRLGGSVRTLEVDVAINGANEPGQVVVNHEALVLIESNLRIASNTQVRFSSQYGFRDTVSTQDTVQLVVENHGWIGAASHATRPLYWAVAAWETINFGRISAGSSVSQIGGAIAVSGNGENYGVVSAISLANFEPNSIGFTVEGWSGIDQNHGLLEAISTMSVTGTNQQFGNNFTNTGFIYVEGGAAYPSNLAVDPLGIIAYRSGGTDTINNSGTVHVVSNTPLVRSVGFRFFPNATYIYSPLTINNSGTIVAERAIIATDGYNTSTYLDNSGHIEGTLELDRGVNQLRNSGTWIGEWTVAFATPDLIDNSGVIEGGIALRGGDDFYRSAPGGVVTGVVSGGAGNDVLQGGTGAERLAGDEGSDRLQGGGGADQLTGGAGADVFVYTSISDSSGTARDTITDFQTGIDRIDISALGATSITFTPSGASTVVRAVTPNGFLDVVVAGTIVASDIVTQAGGAVLTGTGGSDLLYALVPGSTLSGGAGNDALFGTAGDDFLDGGTGADTFYGGAGNDIYIHDNLNDLVVEDAGGGIDEIRTTIGILMPTYIENGRLLGTDDAFLTGNEFDNILVGNAGNNILGGRGGNNTVTGGLGLDTIYMAGNTTAIYLAVADSQRATADRLFNFDSANDRIDLSAIQVLSFTIGEYVLRPETSGLGYFGIDMTLVSIETTQGEFVIEIDGTPSLDAFIWNRPAGVGAILSGLDLDDRLLGTRDADTISGRGGNDTLSGLDGADRLTGGTGDDTIDGGGNVDTAVVAGNRSAYTVTQTATGVFRVVGPDGTDTLTAVEFLQFNDQTLRLRPGTGVSVNFNTTTPATYQTAMNAIRDFDGNALGGNGSWLRIGQADVNGDGDIDQILVNRNIARFATVGTAPDGLVYFSDHSWAGETRVAGIYVDPLVEAGIVQAGSPNDSQRRFQNDLQIENINRVLGANDYDRDGGQEVFFALTDGTAYLRALMHADGNIRYANYMSQQQVVDYLTANGFGPDTYAGWFTRPSDGIAGFGDFADLPDLPSAPDIASGPQAIHLWQADALVAEF